MLRTNGYLGKLKGIIYIPGLLRIQLNRCYNKISKILSTMGEEEGRENCIKISINA